MGYGAVMCGGVQAQQVADAALPDAPAAQSSNSSGASTAQPPHEDPQTKRILGIFPNFRAVSANQHLPPQSVKDKFVTASPGQLRLLRVCAAGAAGGRAGRDTRHAGVRAWRRCVRAVSVALVRRPDGREHDGRVRLPSVTHEDTRYYTLGPGHNAARRWGYALSRAVVTRTDAGNDTFNASEVIGAGAAAGISNLYYPSKERTFQQDGGPVEHECWNRRRHVCGAASSGRTSITGCSMDSNRWADRAVLVPSWKIMTRDAEHPNNFSPIKSAARAV